MLSMKVGRRPETGFGLVELMVAVTLGLFLMAGVVMVFVNSKQTYRESDSLGRLQENARYAFEMLSKDLRVAGYQGCVGNSAQPNITLNNSGSASDSYAWDFKRHAVEGFEATGENTWSSVTSGNPATTVTVADIDANVLSGTDVISMRGIDSAGIHVTGQPSSDDCKYDGDLKVTSNTLLQDNMILLVSDCANSAIFEITNITESNSGLNVEHKKDTGAPPGNSTDNLGACFVGGEVALISAKSYYIRNNPAGQPSLYRKTASNDPEELAEGIENMQILYGEDTTGNGAADVYRKANEVVDWDKVVSVRISLLVRGAEDNVVTTSQTINYNGGDLKAPDRHIRQVYTTTVSIRNRAY